MTGALTISHYSTGIIDMLYLSLSEKHLAALFQEDIFKVLGVISTSVSRAFKSIVKDNINQGKAVSVELSLMTRNEKDKSNGKSKKETEEGYVSHWTPVKDESGRTRFVVLVISPR